MDVEVDRLAIRCRGGTDGSRALAARRRLEQVARGPLPAALARAIGDVDAEVDRLDVRMDVDPFAHDSETLATLWADRIRLALVARLTGTPLPSAPGQRTTVPVAGAVDDGSSTLASHRAADDGTRGWIRLVRMLMVASPAALAAFAPMVVAERAVPRLWASLSSPERAGVLLRLDAAIAALAVEPSGDASPDEPDGVPGRSRREHVSLRSPARVTAAAWEEAWRTLARVAGRRDASSEPEPPPTALAAALATAVGSEPGTRRRTAPGLSSEAGGLVLLYPWLGSYLTRATATLGELHPGDARRVALALITHECVDGTDGGCDHQCGQELRLQHDPLVRVLAGMPPDAASLDLDVGLVPATARHTVATEAAALLRTFAGFLPGFERSTPAFLRRNLVLRQAVVAPAEHAIHVTLPPSALDVLVARLPYPLGTFALGWTQQLHVRLEVA